MGVFDRKEKNGSEDENYSITVDRAEAQNLPTSAEDGVFGSAEEGAVK